MNANKNFVLLIVFAIFALVQEEAVNE